ncbi:hypothetical protein HYS54_04770 [Candidatus Micrarchaeota archaeon]|nr:hypothetical protein [Candidatus Micrarchaeota archaeon]
MNKLSREISQQKEKDLLEGLRFIKLMVKEMKRTPNKKWFGEQARFTNSVVRAAQQASK